MSYVVDYRVTKFELDPELSQQDFRVSFDREMLLVRFVPTIFDEVDEEYSYVSPTGEVTPLDRKEFSEIARKGRPAIERLQLSERESGNEE